MFKIENDQKFHRFAYNHQTGNWHNTHTYPDVRHLIWHFCDISKTIDTFHIAVSDNDLMGSLKRVYVRRDNPYIDWLYMHELIKDVCYTDANLKTINPNDYVDRIKTVKSYPEEYGVSDVGYTPQIYKRKRKDHSNKCVWGSGRQRFYRKYIAELNDPTRIQFSRKKRLAKMDDFEHMYSPRETRRDARSWKNTKCRHQWSRRKPHKDTRRRAKDEFLLTSPSYFYADLTDVNDELYMHMIGYSA